MVEMRMSSEDPLKQLNEILSEAGGTIVNADRSVAGTDASLARFLTVEFEPAASEAFLHRLARHPQVSSITPEPDATF